MRNIILFIAMSLDGYIADSVGKVGWLGGQGNAGEMIDTYSEFAADVDTVVMGWNTYDQIVTELSPEEWVYSRMTCHVITHRDCPSTEKIRFTDENPCSLLERV